MPVPDVARIDRIAGTTCELPNIVKLKTAGPAQS